MEMLCFPHVCWMQSALFLFSKQLFLKTWHVGLGVGADTLLGGLVKIIIKPHVSSSKLEIENIYTVTQKSKHAPLTTDSEQPSKSFITLRLNIIHSN